jgi:hypothetical protein
MWAPLVDRKFLCWLLRISDLPPVPPVNQPAGMSTGGTGGRISISESHRPTQEVLPPIPITTNTVSPKGCARNPFP